MKMELNDHLIQKEISDRRYDLSAILNLPEGNPKNVFISMTVKQTFYSCTVCLLSVVLQQTHAVRVLSS